MAASTSVCASPTSAAAAMLIVPRALLAELEADDVGRRAGDQRRDAHRLEQLVALDYGTRRVR